MYHQGVYYTDHQWLDFFLLKAITVKLWKPSLVKNDVPIEYWRYDESEE